MKRLNLIFVMFLVIFSTRYYAQTNNITEFNIEQEMNKPNADYYDILKRGMDYYESNPDSSEDGEEDEFIRWAEVWKGKVNAPGSKKGDFNLYSRAMQRLVSEAANRSSIDPVCNGSSVTSQWTSVGPNSYFNGGGVSLQQMGMISAVAALPSESNIVYAGSPNGGLFRTNQAAPGANPIWQNLTDQSRLPSGGIADILISPNTNSNGFHDLYISYGPQRWSAWGIGVLKSVDDGATWQETGLNTTFLGGFVNVKKLLMHPTNDQIIYAITNTEAYETIDGGNTWTALNLPAFLMTTFSSPADQTENLNNIIFNPLELNIVYFTGKKCFRYDPSLATSWVYLPQLVTPLGTGQRILLSAAGNNIYGIYRYSSTQQKIDVSTDGGYTWSTLQNNSNLIGAFFVVSPANPNIMYLGDDPGGSSNRRISKSINGGLTFSHVTDYYETALSGGVSSHGDIRALKLINGSANGDNDFLLGGTDGGILYSTTAPSMTASVNWTNLNGTGLNIMQFIGIGGYEEDPDYIVGGTQDNGINTYYHGTWKHASGGDGYECAIDPNSPGGQIAYGQYDGGGGLTLLQSNTFGASWTGTATQVPNYSTFHFKKSMQVNKSNNKFYVAYHDLFSSSTPTLALSSAASKITNFTIDKGVQICRNIAAFDVSQKDPNIIYVGYDGQTWNVDLYSCDANNCDAIPPCTTSCALPTLCPLSKKLFKTLDGGASWIDITDVGNDGVGDLFPVRWFEINSMATNPDDPNEIYVTFNGIWAYSSGVGCGRVMRSIDGGNTWSEYSQGLAEFPVNTIVFEKGANVAYVGTDIGVFYRKTNDPGSQWQCFNQNLPVTTVLDLEINYCAGLIRAATHGRGVWESPLAPDTRILSVSVSQNPVCLTQTAILTVTSQISGSTYNWYDAASGGNLLGTGGTFTIPALATTTTFYVDETNSACTGTRTAITVTVNPVPPEDLYIKDIPTDDGVEPTPGNAWDLVDGTDVWVRNQAETMTSSNPPHYTNEHIPENAEWNSLWATDNNFLPRIYAKVRNRGCNTVTGIVHLYYHKLTTNDHWDTFDGGNNTYGSWEEIVCGDTDGDGYIDNGETACDNQITLGSGQDGVIEQVWYQAKYFPDPNSNRNEYCLLSRLICDGGVDQITTEQLSVSAGTNAQNSNNITQKNVMFVNDFKICNNIDFGNVSPISSVNKLNLIDNSPTPFIGANGLISIDLGQTLYNAWVQGGRKGSGIADGRDKYNHMSPTGVLHNHSHLNPGSKPYEITLTGGAATIENIALPPNDMEPICTMFNYYPGPASTTPFQYSFSQYESFGNGQPNYKYTGAVKFYITKPQCPSVNAGSDITIGRICSAQLTASPVIAGATYTWRDDASGDSIGSGISVSVSPHNTTSYELEMTTPNGCIAYDVATVIVDPNTIACGCPGPTFDKVILKKDKIIYNENVVIKDKLTVPAGVTLTIKESEFLFMKDAILEVLPGGKLEIINSYLRSCNSLEHWKMIKVRGNNGDVEQLKISGSTINDAITAIVMEFVKGSKIIGNTFNGGSGAIDMSFSQDFVIRDNSFLNSDIAIKTNNSYAGTSSVIERNIFSTNKTAIQFTNDLHSHLDINCNKFNNYADYAIYSKMSTLKNQGTSVLGAGNTFISTSTKVNNKLYHNGPTMKYYYDPSIPVNLNTSGALTAMAVASQSDNNCGLHAMNNQPANETESAINAMEHSELINATPNPASDKTTIVYKLSSDVINAEIKITNLLGEVIAKYPVTSGTNSLEIDCSGFANGIYFYSLSTNINLVNTKKMIISK